MSATAKKPRQPRISVPDDQVRTREVILADSSIYVTKSYVWVTCWNCGGSGNYPSSMTPPGQCRLYCWAKPHTDPIAAAMGALPPCKSADDPTYGRLAKSIDKYVKECQAADRAEYRARVRDEQERPEREARAAARQAEFARQEAERQAESERRAADETARLSISQWVGTIGERIESPATLVDCRSFPGQYGPRAMYRFRDDAGNVLVWWTTGALDMSRGARGTIKATIKEHGEYKGERQTVLLRATVVKAKT